jgi:hypothetical protein
MILTKCSCCGKERFKRFNKGVDLVNEAEWMSDIIIIPFFIAPDSFTKKYTICIECRKKSFSQILTEIKRGELNEISKGKKSKSCRPTSNTQSRGNNRTSRKRVGVQKVADKKPKRRSNRRVR